MKSRIPIIAKYLCVPREVMRFGVCAITLLLGSHSAPAQTIAQTIAVMKCPPPARLDDAKDTYANAVVADHYRWLEDQSAPETRAWIAAEQSCTEAALSKLPGRTAISKRMSELMHNDTTSLPIERNGRYFFIKRFANQDIAKLYVRRTKNGVDEVLIDPLPWSAGHTATVVLENVSPDGKLLVYGRREGGQDEVTVYVYDVDSQREMQDVLPAANYFSMAATTENRGVYYTKSSPQGPRAFYHPLGTDPAADKVVFGEFLGKDDILSLALSPDGRYVLYYVEFGDSDRNDVYLQNLAQQRPAIAVVQGIPAIFDVSFGGDNLFIRTNWKAPLWRVFATKLTAPSQQHWREIIPESKLALRSLVPAGGKLVAQYLQSVASQIKVFNPDGKKGRSVAMPGLGSTEIAGRWESKELLYSFTSFNVPGNVYAYDVDNRRSALWFRENIPFDSSAFETRQVWYESKDKTRVPMFLFHKKGLKNNGNVAVLLTGYGGFGAGGTPRFNPLEAFWVEHGGLVAHPSLRGDGAFGEDWHRNGMFEKKQNVFNDFIAAAEYLIAQKYTNPTRLSISGLSNGGLLVGAALTQRPDLFQAAICSYPLLDMLRYHKFNEGPYWVSEYGSSDDPRQFPYLYAYSPYHRVMKGNKYPAVLFITGDGDTRVAPLHARKMAALLQASTGSERPILLLYDTESGHSGGRPINKLIEAATDTLSFLFWQLKIE